MNICNDDILSILKCEFPFENKKLGRTYLLWDVINVLLINKNIVKASELLGNSKSSLEKLCVRYLNKYFPNKVLAVSWRDYFLFEAGCKECQSCNLIKLHEEYTYSKASSLDSLDYRCKSCKSISREYFTKNNPEYNQQTYRENKADYINRAIKYKTNRTMATPSWANLDKIKEIYDTCPTDYHVDHIVPLKGKNVCGLHVEYNLQHLPAIDNIKKSNKF